MLFLVGWNKQFFQKSQHLLPPPCVSLLQGSSACSWGGTVPQVGGGVCSLLSSTAEHIIGQVRPGKGAHLQPSRMKGVLW